MVFKVHTTLRRLLVPFDSTKTSCQLFGAVVKIRIFYDYKLLLKDLGNYFKLKNVPPSCIPLISRQNVAILKVFFCKIRSKTFVIVFLYPNMLFLIINKETLDVEKNAQLVNENLYRLFYFIKSCD